MKLEKLLTQIIIESFNFNFSLSLFLSSILTRYAFSSHRISSQHLNNNNKEEEGANLLALFANLLALFVSSIFREITFK